MAKYITNKRFRELLDQYNKTKVAPDELWEVGYKIGQGVCKRFQSYLKIDPDEAGTIGAMAMITKLNKYKPESGDPFAYFSRVVENDLKNYRRQNRKHGIEGLNWDTDGNEKEGRKPVFEGRAKPVEIIKVKIIASANWNTRVRSNGKLEPMYTAFGETKSLTAWTNDARCIVNRETLYMRIKTYKWEPEMALTLELKTKLNTKRWITAWGEKKSVNKWLLDKRCMCDKINLNARIWELDWIPEIAITTKPYTVRGDEHKRDGKKRPGPTAKPIKLTAFGETKSLSQWCRDKRCRISLSAMREGYWKHWKHEHIIAVPRKMKRDYYIRHASKQQQQGLYQPKAKAEAAR